MQLRAHQDACTTIDGEQAGATPWGMAMLTRGDLSYAHKLPMREGHNENKSFNDVLMHNTNEL